LDLTSPLRVTAVLPAYNEEAVIADVVRRTAAAMLKLGVPDPEIIVVDDGSKDATARCARSKAPVGVEVRVIAHPLNRGYGAALRTGFENARGDAVWLMDSDGQFDPGDLARLLPHYRADRVVCGYRIRRSDKAVRRWNHTAFFTLVRFVVGRTTRDVNCGFKLFPRSVGRGLRLNGALISTELIVRARKAGYQPVEVGVPHYPRTAGQATGANPRVVARAFGELWRFRRDLHSINGLTPPG
jgi:glycosyltransferase involved in cell wall biosynthesis